MKQGGGRGKQREKKKKKKNPSRIIRIVTLDSLQLVLGLNSPYSSPGTGVINVRFSSTATIRASAYRWRRAVRPNLNHDVFRNLTRGNIRIQTSIDG